MISRNKKRRMRRSGGFTLIELMVVIVILGLLAALVAPKVLDVADKGRVTATKTQITSFKTALMQYKLEFNKFPTTSEGLNALINNSKNKKYLDSNTVPLDSWDNAYIYTSPGSNGNDYEIVSLGEDGQKGGTEYNADIVSWNLQGDAE